uniref:LID domain-containing protein n=1 Tax=Macrostomum lignano TaxID=282301 RepID=A0A1I8HQR1_9PLAT
MGTPDVRIHEMNKRLQQRPECESDGQNFWWDQFATEFFEDDSVLTIQLLMEDGPKRYSIGRTLIPRYFRSIFDGGVADMYIFLKNARESFHNTSLTLDCDRGEMHATHVRPMLTNVVTEGRLVLEFTFDDMMRIKSWLFQIRSCREMVPRQAVGSHQDPQVLDQMSHNITRQGITNHTLHFLRLCIILEPMQELMSRQKAYGLHPRDCLKTTLFQKWQRMVAPPESSRTQSKRRKRKTNSSNSGNNNNNNNGIHGNAPETDSTPATSVGRAKKGKKKTTGAANPLLLHKDVMIVGEPTLMGGEFGAEDERLITRLENRQFNPNALPNGCLRSGPGGFEIPACGPLENSFERDSTGRPVGRFASMLSQHCPNPLPPPPPTPLPPQGYFTGSKQPSRQLQHPHAAYSCPPQNGFEFVTPRTPSQAWPTLSSMVEQQQASGSQTPPQTIQQQQQTPQQQQNKSHTAIKA